MLGHHQVGPPFDFLRFLPNNLRESLHPSIFLLRAVSIKVDCFPIAKPNAEAFFHKHVTFLFLRKGGFSSASTLTRCLFLDECRLVINQLTCSREIYCRPWLSRDFMVSGEFGAFQSKESTTPVLLPSQCAGPLAAHD